MPIAILYMFENVKAHYYIEFFFLKWNLFSACFFYRYVSMNRFCLFYFILVYIYSLYFVTLFGECFYHISQTTTYFQYFFFFIQ